MTKMPPSPIAVLFIAEPSVSMVRSYEPQSLGILFNAHILSFSASPVFTPSTSKAWFPDCSQVGRSHRVIYGCVDSKIDLRTSLAFFLQLVFFVRWRTSAVAICLHGLLSGIQIDFGLTAPFSTTCSNLLQHLLLSVVWMSLSPSLCPVSTLQQHRRRG